MKKKSSIRFYCLVICLMYGRKVTGSELDLTYTTEVQTNFRKEGKWVNLLRLDYSCPGEVTCRWACTSRMTVQPAIHIIRNSNGNYAAGLLRMYYVW